MVLRLVQNLGEIPRLPHQPLLGPSPANGMDS